MLSNTWAVGSYSSVAEAAKAHDVIAIGLHGRNAVLNFPAGHYALRDVTEVSGRGRGRALEGGGDKCTDVRNGHVADYPSTILHILFVAMTTPPPRFRLSMKRKPGRSLE